MLDNEIERAPRISKARLIEGRVGETLMKLTLPMIFASLSMVVFNLTDTFFVGKLGAKELAAMSFSFPVVLFIVSIAMGMGMGVSSVVSRAIGEGDRHKVQRLTTDGLALSLLMAVCFSIFGLLTIDPVFRLLGAGHEILPYIKEYIAIWYTGLIFIFIPMVGNNAIRATGDTKTPSLIMIIAVVTNIILDPLLIFGLGVFPKLGLPGAALATVISRVLTCIMVLWVLRFREKIVDLSLPEMKDVFHSWKQILYIGIPSAATNIMAPLSLGVVTVIIARYGAEAVAALGVGSRIESLVLMVIIALATVLIPFIGQNWGAGKRGRVDQALRYSFKFSVAWGTVMFFIFAMAARPVAVIFNKDPQVVAAIITYLCYLPVGNGFQGVFLLTGASLNAVNRPLQSAVLTVVRMLVFYIPLAYIGSWLLGLKGVFGGVGLCNILTGLLSYFWLRKLLDLTDQTSQTGRDCSYVADEKPSVKILR